MGLRDRREERREDRRGIRPRRQRHRYQMRQKMVSIGDDYWIENEDGERVYRVDGKALRLREHARPGGRRRHQAVPDPDPGACTSATPWRSRTRTASAWPWCTRRSSRRCGSGGRSTCRGRAGLEVQGNIVDHEYEIEADGRKIAEISKKWFRVRDTYGVEISARAGPGPRARGHGRHRHDGPPRQVTRYLQRAPRPPDVSAAVLHMNAQARGRRPRSRALSDFRGGPYSMKGTHDGSPVRLVRWALPAVGVVHRRGGRGRHGSRVAPSTAWIFPGSEIIFWSFATLMYVILVHIRFRPDRRGSAFGSSLPEYST